MERKCHYLLRMYASHGRLEEATQVFTNVAVPDSFMWFSMIRANAEHGRPVQAIKLYKQMRDSVTKPNNHVFVAVLKACASAIDLESGKQVHSDVVQSQVRPNIFVANGLVDMYAKCGSLKVARQIFDSLSTRDVVTWNAMIAGYAQQGHAQEALSLHTSMQDEGIIRADRVTFVCLLKACARLGALHQGKHLHSQIKERGLEADVVLGNSLVDMYARCGSVVDARRVFDNMLTRDVVTWTAMIAGYAQDGQGQEALTLYARMQHDSVSSANEVTFMHLLKACASMGALQQGKQLHSQIQERGFAADLVVGSSLVDMYAKCGSLVDARRVFDNLPTKNVVTWTSMIAGYAQQKLGEEALALYARMQQDGLSLEDRVTFVCLLKACASIGALHQGKQLHSRIQERGLAGDVVIGNCLVDMYVKCGQLQAARRVFDCLPTKNVVTWTAMIHGYSQSNQGNKAIECFQEMQEQGVQPNEATFVSLLVACSHEGMLKEGKQYFKMMVEDHGITPNSHHISCMVDLLGRSGCLNEAESILLTMPLESNVGWMSLLNACRSYGDVERAKRCFDHIVDVQPQHAAAYVLLANIYGDAGRWRDAEKVEYLRRSAAACKKPATASIEVNNNVHLFVVGEERSDISSKLRSVNTQLEDKGHWQHTELISKPVSDHHKEDALCGHAEKLALAYGLLNTSDGTTLVVTKNLRMCNDCHSGTKIMSRIEKREIIVRDAHRVHHFVDGCCTCGDRH